MRNGSQEMKKPVGENSDVLYQIICANIYLKRLL
jgi:hypothetical protein